MCYKYFVMHKIGNFNLNYLNLILTNIEIIFSVI